MFDNESGLTTSSRVLELSLDEALGEAAIAGSWPLGLSCAIEGGAYELSNGNLLATCAMQARFYEIDRATGAILRDLGPTCGTLFDGLLPRGIPVAL
jgi:hypothetical protein